MVVGGDDISAGLGVDCKWFASDWKLLETAFGNQNLKKTSPEELE